MSTVQGLPSADVLEQMYDAVSTKQLTDRLALLQASMHPHYVSERDHLVAEIARRKELWHVGCDGNPPAYFCWRADGQELETESGRLRQFQTPEAAARACPEPHHKSVRFLLGEEPS